MSTIDTSLDADARIDALCDELVSRCDPKTAPAAEFLGHQFDLGLAWVNFPEGHGGLGLSPRLQTRINRHLEAADAPSAWLRNPIGYGMGAPTIVTHGSDDQKRRYLRPLFTGEEIWCQLFSEPGAGSDLAAAATRAVRDLEALGVQVWTEHTVTAIDPDGVQAGSERLDAATVLWAAGVEASPLGRTAGFDVDRQGRVIVEPDLTVKGYPHVFVAGDQACFRHQNDRLGTPLPGTATVAMQQGRYIGQTIAREVRGRARVPFRFVDKGQMATIGRSRAILERGSLRLTGFSAWAMWLAVHIYYLTGFRNRLLVVVQWAWSYLTFGRGARLIVGEDHRKA